METQEMIVIKKTNEIEDILLIVKEAWFETKKYCETYGDFGQICGCYVAGCYSLDNSESFIHRELLSAIDSNFNIKIHRTFDNRHGSSFTSVSELIQLINELKEEDVNVSDMLENIKIGDIEYFANSWIEENETHTEIRDACTFWNGSNYKTITLSSEFGEANYERIDEELEKEILEDYETCSYDSESFGHKFYKGKKYIFDESACQGSFELFTVSEIEEE